MSGPELPDAPPPEVPEEFADAYREAYRAALGSTPRETPPGGHRGTPATRWRVPVLVAVGALVLILAAYLLGRLFSGGTDDASPEAVVPSAQTPQADPVETPAPEVEDDDAWEGAVEPVPIERVTVGCTSRPSVDAAGRKVHYRAGNAIDADPTTAWRCDGDASDRALTLRLPSRTTIGEVGLIPGYAKTDPSSGVDRYAENNRITQVTWTFEGDDGPVLVEQRLDGSPTLRAMQTLRIPPVSANRVLLRIDSVVRGPRNTTAISEIHLSAVAD